MGRKLLWLGSGIEGAAVDVITPSAPSWPDIDVRGLAQDIVSPDKLAGVKALALSPWSDWDAVIVKYKSGQQELLTPGRVLVLPASESIADFLPPTPMAPTRPYDATLQRSKRPDPSTLAGKWFVFTDGTYQIAPTGPAGGTRPLYQWDGSEWTFYNNMANGAVPFLPGSLSLALTNSVQPRATDWSPDGVWSFADYAENGWLDGNNDPLNGLAYVSYYALGNLGTPGDPVNYSTAQHFAFRWAGLTPKFFGRLALDLFDGECVDWAPRMPPQRQLCFSQLNVTQLTVNADPLLPQQVVVTVPAFNVRGVEFLFHNGSAHPVYVSLVSPSTAIPYAQPDGVTVLAGSPPVSYATVPAGEDGSVVLDDVRHPFVKLVIGAGQQNGAFITAGALLTLTRRVTQ